jgi:DNA-binding Lrp family transcriptional regulator
VAARIDPDHIDEAAAIISRHPGVSHNYKRNHSYNLWYTLAVPPGEDFDEHLDALHRESGSLVTRKLPTLKLYKIGVKLDMTGNTAANAKAEVLAHEKPERREVMDAPALSEWDTAVICIAQEDLPLTERPFETQAAAINGTEDQLLETLQSLKDRKLMRRFAAVMNHRSAGFKANAMGVWAVPEDRLEEIGPQMAGFAAVSHCYKRPTYEDWPYTVFTMVHGRTGKDCEATIDAIREETGVDEYALLWSVSLVRSACLPEQHSSQCRKSTRPHVASVLAPDVVERMRHAAQVTNPPRLHQRFEGVLSLTGHLLLFCQVRFSRSVTRTRLLARAWCNSLARY